MPDVAYACWFDIGLAELPRRLQRDTATVLRRIADAARYSVFDATATIDIARTLDRIERNGLIRRTGGDYPWVEITLTDAGTRMLQEAEQ